MQWKWKACCREERRDRERRMRGERGEMGKDGREGGKDERCKLPLFGNEAFSTTTKMGGGEVERTSHRALLARRATLVRLAFDA
jgi:hypothetical protein